MKLSDISASGFESKNLAFDKELTTDMQIKLRDLGILDPPVDGDFGPVSKLALRKFAALARIEFDQVITRPLAQALRDSGVDTLLPLTFGTDFASRVIKFMQLKDHWFARLPDYFNIVYVEGIDEDGSLNSDAPNQFNDRRLVIAIKDGRPTFRLNLDATTEPGDFFVNHPKNPKGAARIGFGQYKAWQVGIHRRGTPSAHEALVQVGPVKVHRDFNKDGKRTDDPVDIGSSFGINQHQGFNMPPTNIGKASAGCLVGRTNKGHQEFMKLVKADARFVARSGYTFITTVLAGDELRKTVG